MRRNPKPQKTKENIRPPIAAAPMYAGSGICPTTAVSTTPISGVETFEIMTGTANFKMAL